MKKFILFFSACSLALASCSTDFDVIDNYKETTVVFGLLDQNDTAQYLKINKAFLGEGNALIMAQQYDSINYGNQLNVKLEQLRNGSVIKSLTIKKDSSINKEPGTFNNSKQILYKVTDKLHKGSQTDDDTTYRLTIINNSTNNIITAETPLISGFSVGFPKPTTTTFDFSGNSGNGLNTLKTVQWVSGKNGILYEFVLRFHYTEVDKATNVKTYKYVDWFFPQQKSQSLSGGETMTVTFKGQNFYTFLGDAISPSNNKVWRYPGKLDFMFSVASDQFNTYMEVNAPSTGIVQEKPQYTNITNGVGLFASRLRDNSRKNISLHPNTLVELYTGQYMQQYTGQTIANLGFCDSIPSRTYSCN